MKIIQNQKKYFKKGERYELIIFNRDGPCIYSDYTQKTDLKLHKDYFLQRN